MRGLRVIDISDLAHPAARGFCSDLGQTWSLAASGNHVYAADEGRGVRVIDVTDPMNPHEVASFDTLNSAGGITVSGDYAYVADMYAGLLAFDISNPQAPQEAGHYRLPRSSLGLVVDAGRAYIADRGAGLQIVEFYGAGVEEERSTPYALRATPAPTIVRGVLELSPGKPGQSTTGQSLVFLLDVSGRKVMELQPGPNDVSRFGAGVYFVRVQGSGTGGQGEVRKVVLTQ